VLLSAEVPTWSGAVDGSDGSRDGGACVGVEALSGEVGSVVAPEPFGTLGPALGAESLGLRLGLGVAGLEGGGDEAGGVEGLLEGGGASGTVGVTGASDAARRNGSAIRAAATQDRPTPAAARSTRRREASRRIAS
jgi:hypothetical protein